MKLLLQVTLIFPCCSLCKKRHHLVGAQETMLQDSPTKLDLRLIKPLNLTTTGNIEGKMCMSKHTKEIQSAKCNMGNSKEQMTWFLIK